MAVLLLVVAGALAVLWSRQAPPPAVARATPPPQPLAHEAPGPWGNAEPGPDPAAAPSQAALRVQRAQQTLDNYVQATKYPPTSRPLREHPDLIEPLNKVDHRQILVPGGQARLRLRYDRTFVVGDDAVVIRLSGEDSAGNPAPCEILSANASAAPVGPDAGKLAAVPLVFTGDGPGSFTTRFQPGKQGFAQHLGGIRIAVHARVADEDGTPSFDLYYTPTPPAVFTRAVREVLDNGSLTLNLGINVHKAGRYLINARVDDANGNGFAFLAFNDEVAEGAQEIPLVVFGKLIHDGHAGAPFKLRDVEGFLLKEDTDPDRELVQPLLGTVYTTQAYPQSAFSDQEWQSEQRTRTIDEFTRNLKDLKQQAGSP
ncbi:MAG TPA: hypothetical protein VFP84_01315 [Kofleriaceae bacterium]|nr:hypothetical protein [Kofleriaceae bacterium]